MKETIKCPSCGAENAAYGPCACCGTVIEEPEPPEAKGNEKKIADYIIPFTHSKEEVKGHFLDLLIMSEKAPSDIIENLKIESISPQYDKEYLFRGSYVYNWNCTIVQEIPRQRWTKDLLGEWYLEDYTETKYIPSNGSSRGKFSLIRENYSGQCPSTARPFSPSDLDGSIPVHGLSPEQSFKSYAYNAIYRKAESDAAYQTQFMSKNRSGIIETKWSCDPEIILFPAWKICYDYKGSKCETYISDTSDGLYDESHLNLPQPKASAKAVYIAQAVFDSKKKEPFDDFGVFAFLVCAILMTLIVCVSTGLINDEITCYSGVHWIWDILFSLLIFLLSFILFRKNISLRNKYNAAVEEYNTNLNRQQFNKVTEDRQYKAAKAKELFGHETKERIKAKRVKKVVDPSTLVKPLPFWVNFIIFLIIIIVVVAARYILCPLD